MEKNLNKIKLTVSEAVEYILDGKGIIFTDKVYGEEKDSVVENIIEELKENGYKIRLWSNKLGWKLIELANY